MRSVAIALMIMALISGCKKRMELETTFDDSAPSTVLEGPSLQNEMSASPAREAPAPFTRIGFLWDAPSRESLEVATSTDGKTFTEFKPVTIYSEDIEGTMVFSGEHQVIGEQARFYRLRSQKNYYPSYIKLEFLQEKIEEVASQPGLMEAIPEKEELQYKYGNLTIHSRAAWGASAARCAGTHKGDRISIHHTDSPLNDTISVEARLRQTQAYHMKTRGWCDVGYHYFVAQDGRIFQGRQHHLIGAHVLKQNTQNIGISNVGSFSEKPVTEAHLNSIAALAKTIAQQDGFQITEATLKGHRDQLATSCPGEALYKQLPEVRARALKDVQPATPGVVAAGTLVGLIYRGENTNERLAGATVKLNNGQTIKTDAKGMYRFEKLKAGTYTITAESQGFPSKSITRDVAKGLVWGSIGL